MITELHLINFRNHQDLSINSDKKFVIISGLNGSGKTNILESISLFSLGKGIRNAKIESLFTKTTSNFHKQLAVHLISVHNNRPNHMSFCYTNNVKTNITKRTLQINQEEVKKKTAFLDLLKIFWFIPQMSNIYIDTPSTRRKFLDRMVFNFFPNHAGNILHYEYHMQSRMKILITGNYNSNSKWLDNTEEQMAKLALSISKTRHTYCDILTKHLLHLQTSFLKPNISLAGFISKEELTNCEEEILIKKISDRLKKNRISDLKRKKTDFGVHKMDIDCEHPIKQIHASLCSTGEQKAMVISLLLAQIHAINKEQKAFSIFLLDELFAHFDDKKQKLLIEELSLLNSQIWVTSTNKFLYKDFEKNSVININLNYI